MRKKELATLPVMPAKGKGRIVAARVDGDTLVLDGYNNGQYVGRYCIRDNGEYMSYVNGVWRQQKLRDMLSQRSYSYWGNYVSNPDVCATKQQEADAEAFLEGLDRSGYTNVERKVTSAEYHYMSAQRDRAWKRKADRINARMDTIPVLPEGFDPWCKEVVFGNKQFLFKTDKPNVYFCTACGKTHQAKNARNNKPFLCTRTDQTVTVSKSLDTRERKDHAMVLQWTTTNERVARHFTVHSYWSAKGQRIAAYEDIRYILKPSGCNEWYYGQYRQADEFAQDWWESNPRGKHTFREYCYPEGVKEILAETVWARIGIPEMAAKGWRVWYNKLMIDGKYCHCYEYLAKGGYRKLVEDASGWPLGHIEYRGATLEQVLGIDKQRANRLRQANGGLVYLKWMRWEKKNNRHLSEKTVRWMQENYCEGVDIDFALEYMSPEQVMNYLQRQREQSGKSYSWLLDEWKDTLHMAKQLKMDVKDEIVYRPRDLIAAHDRLVQRINEKAAIELEKSYEKKFPGLGKVCETLKKYEWSDGVYSIVAPARIADVLSEGKCLNHCVTNERYFERMAKEESYILFLRRADKPDIPWYTLEVEPGGVIRQKRTKFNRQEKDLEPAKAFLKRWQQEIVRRVSARERDLQKKSAAARNAEIAQLRRDGIVVHGGEMSGTLLADVLIGDLMEITA